MFNIGDKVIYSGETNHNHRASIIQIKNTGAYNYKLKFWDSQDELWTVGSMIKLIEKGVSGMSCNEPKGEGRGLYEVFVVNPDEEGAIIVDEKVIANDEADALLTSSYKEKLASLKLKKGQVDTIIRRIGTIRNYETVQKVNLVGSIDGYKLVKEAK